MCSLHPRIAKKFNELFDEVRQKITTEVGDGDLYTIKATKLKAIDELNGLQGCPALEHYLKVLNLPTPNKTNLPMMQKHLEDLIAEFRR
ncbi:MAG: hypothetical protein LHV69_08585 [Elusimicrobia bacterium]|nr:hypothetical protein [Candidatus Obscuribacterium magneticum]